MPDQTPAAAAPDETNDAAVIAALRLAVVGAPNNARTVKMVRLLLDEAAPTPQGDTTGPALLVDLLRKGRLTASIKSSDAQPEGEPRA